MNFADHETAPMKPADLGRLAAAAWKTEDDCPFEADSNEAWAWKKAWRDARLGMSQGIRMFLMTGYVSPFLNTFVIPAEVIAKKFFPHGSEAVLMIRIGRILSAQDTPFPELNPDDLIGLARIVTGVLAGVDVDSTVEELSFRSKVMANLATWAHESATAWREIAGPFPDVPDPTNPAEVKVSAREAIAFVLDIPDV